MSNVDWLQSLSTSGATSVGPGTLNYIVAQNTDSMPRTGTLTVAGQTFTVTQAAGASTVNGINSPGRTREFSMHRHQGCAWIWPFSQLAASRFCMEAERTGHHSPIHGSGTDRAGFSEHPRIIRDTSVVTPWPMTLCTSRVVLFGGFTPASDLSE